MSILGKSNLNVYHNPEIEIKITVVGESGVGKSTLSQRIAYDKFKVDIESTIGAAFCTFRCSYENTNYVFKLWDTAGQERFDALVPMYLNGSHIVLMVFDITNYSSFEKIKDKWYKRVIDRVPNAHILLIGNKADLKSDPQADLKNQNADNNDDFNVINDFIGNKIKYLECSAKNGTGMSEMAKTFLEIASSLKPRNDNIIQLFQEPEVRERCFDGIRCYPF